MTDGLSDDQRARIVAEDEQRRLAYLYDVTSTLFGEPLEVARRLARVSQLLVPDMGDWCWIDLLEGGELRRVVTHHWNPARLEGAAHVSAANPELLRIARTGEPELIVEGLEDVVDAPAALRSLLRVPLRDSTRVAGVISVGFAESNRKHRPPDLELVHAIAIRAGWALDAARQYEVATKAVAAREDILAVVAHDLRGSLATVMLAAELLRGTAESSLGERIDRAGARMERLIADLLDWTSIESGHLRVTVLPVSARSLISESVEALLPLAIATNKRLEVVGNDHDVMVSCDRARTFQVISNLVGNAIKFTPRGIQIVVEVEPDCLRVTVADEGPGIAAEHLPHVFERYWQADSGTQQRRGIGLGLAISRGIVVAQGGSISATSPPGSGARFSFTIPLSRA